MTTKKFFVGLMLELEIKCAGDIVSHETAFFMTMEIDKALHRKDCFDLDGQRSERMKLHRVPR